MPSASVDEKAKIIETIVDYNNSKTIANKKKKRPRIRVRSRNKACRLVALTEASSTSSSKEEEIIKDTKVNSIEMNNVKEKSIDVKDLPVGKSREEIKAEREAKKQAKQLKKTKTIEGKIINGNETATLPAKENIPIKSENIESAHVSNIDLSKSREQIKAEREAKRLAKSAAKKDGNEKPLTNISSENIKTNSISEEKKKPILTKAERRAIQEAQRAAKAQVNQKPTIERKTLKENITKVEKTEAKTEILLKNKNHSCTVKLFNHLECGKKNVNQFVNNTLIHPAIVRLGEQYATRTIVGSNARCLAFLNALKMVIQDYETPAKKEFARSLEASLKHCVKHLQACRPLAVSVTNAHKHIKHLLTQLPLDKPESESKEHLCQFIDTYVENQINKAAQAISESVQEKIKNGDVLLTFGCSSLIEYICEQAKHRQVDFRVIVVDSRPFCEGQEMLRRLTAQEIPCTYVLINAIGFVMPEATKVLLGAHALLSNGYVMSRTGTAQVALVARTYNVPVLVCCETHKFSERFQTDAIVYNELGDPEDLVRNAQCSLTNWQTKGKMTPLNLMYDVTPPELVTAVVTDVSILPCTSVPVILRIKPAEIGYYG